jgi:hypothetical protein
VQIIALLPGAETRNNFLKMSTLEINKKLFNAHMILIIELSPQIELSLIRNK